MSCAQQSSDCSRIFTKNHREKNTCMGKLTNYLLDPDDDDTFGPFDLGLDEVRNLDAAALDTHEGQIAGPFVSLH